MKYLFSLIVIFLICFNLQAQPWHSLLKTSNANFYHNQKAFNSYWQGKEIEKGKGWKPYKRWEYFMEPRVYPSGKFQGDKIWSELHKKKKNEKREHVHWELAGPYFTPEKTGIGRLNCIEFHPTNPACYWVGAPAGGVWETTNNGESWQTLTEELACIGISDIAVNPKNTDEIYIATGDGDAMDTYSIGVLKSTDGGRSWNTTGLSLMQDSMLTIRRLLIDPSNTQKIIAATDVGIYSSDDAGDNWKMTFSGSFKDIEFKPDDSQTIYATSYGIPFGGGIFRSTDGGYTFSDISPAYRKALIERVELATTKANPDILYALCSKSLDGGLFAVYRSEDKGTTWKKTLNGNMMNLLGWETDASDEGGQGWYDLALAVSPINENEIYVGGINIWKSSDGGFSWQLETEWAGRNRMPYVHADHHEIQFSPITKKIFSANDGGIFMRENNNWRDISNGLQILQIYKTSISAISDDIYVSGSQDNGTILNNKNNWSMILDGDGMDCAIDYKNNNIVYASYPNGEIFVSYDRGKNFYDIMPDSELYGAWVTPFLIHPNNEKTIYVAYQDLYKSTDRGNNWTILTKNLTINENIISFVVAPSDDRVIYVATYNQIWQTTNEGNSWIEITHGLPSNAITDIEINDKKPQKIWVTLSGFSKNEKVYTSNNGGNTWQNISDGLPNLPANCIVFQKNSENTLYVGTDIGVYFFENKNSKWIDFSNGMPNVPVSDLEIQYKFNRLYAGTYGRGLWKSPLTPNANFYADTLRVNRGDTITFIDSSFLYIDSYTWNFGENALPKQATGLGPHRVVFQKSGKQTVSLTVEYDNFSHTVEKSEYIEILEDFGVKIYPNPAHDNFFIEIISIEKDDIDIEILSTNGKIVYKKKVEKTQNFFLYEINRTFASGIYLLKIKQNNNEIVEKIVISK